ncbi:IclR family transcriptional regulator [Methylobacterium tarhaniae]|uniref:IclR family transcriptional regulator n=1 Tax=Methylobacterium tarhaniae TaxID=1187852 RepID=UPI003D03BB45
MSSLAKMLGVLDLFDEHRAGITLEDVVQRTQASRATAYRYLQALTQAGLVVPAAGGTYGLGPRIVEFDRLLRIADPLLTRARSPIRALSATLEANVLLCGYYGDKVLCVDIVWPDQSVASFYERGRPMPMFRGAMAKTILAHLSPYQLRNLMARHGQDIRQAGLGDDWAAFRRTMSRLRRAGIVITHGEVVPDLVGLGAPLFNPEGGVLGSVVLAIPAARLAADGEETYATALAATAARINLSLARAAGAPATAEPSRPPRSRTAAGGEK